MSDLTGVARELGLRGTAYLNTAGLILPSAMRGLLKDLLEIIEALAREVDEMKKGGGDEKRR